MTIPPRLRDTPYGGGQTISPRTRLANVHLSVASLDKQLDFYENVLRLRLHWRQNGSAGLGAGGDDLLVLTEVPQARRFRGHTGMYHFALLLPDRGALAKAIARLFKRRWPNYPTDHVVTKTTYLDDPEGNNIELYAITREDGVFREKDGEMEIRWADGRESDGREPLDLEKLFGELRPDDDLEAPLPPQTHLGHIHLYAASLEDSMRFYHESLGFAKGGWFGQFRMADVLLNGEMPHVVAFNTWQGEGIPSAPEGALGLRYFTLLLPERSELDRLGLHLREAGFSIEAAAPGLFVKDPSGIRLLLTDQLP